MKTRFFYLIVLLVLASCGNEASKIAYVQNFKLYAEFDLSKELDADLQVFSDQRMRELDSLKIIFEQKTVDFQNMEEIPAEDYKAYNDLRNTLMFRQKSYEEDLIAKSQEYDQQIWERLNGYIAEYATENDYDFILGASGDGNLMFAKDTLDITDELIAYCNTNYSGK
ncbi:MAG: OmpH family outer membrane protein [Flavobacteriales bacterium]|nr:OmpH family outer membrane protein [Flavobacteriales bacterium]